MVSLGNRHRRATTLTEMIVAFVLTTSLLSMAVPMVVRNIRLQVSSRHERVALEELSNQLDRLTSASTGSLRQELMELEPSEFAESTLPSPSLQGTVQEDEGGLRISLELTWEETGRDQAPLRLTTWVYSNSKTDLGSTDMPDSQQSELEAAR